MTDEATTAATQSDPFTPSPSTVCHPPPCEAKTPAPTNLPTSTHGGAAGGNKRPQRNARSAPPTDNSPRAPTKDNPRQDRDPATTNNPDGRGRGASGLWAPPTAERPPPPPNPQTGKAVLSFFIEMACVFFIHGAAHTNSANLLTSTRGREAGGNTRPQRNARSAPPADNSARAL